MPVEPRCRRILNTTECFRRNPLAVLRGNSPDLGVGLEDLLERILGSVEHLVGGHHGCWARPAILVITEDHASDPSSNFRDRLSVTVDWGWRSDIDGGGIVPVGASCVEDRLVVQEQHVRFLGTDHSGEIACHSVDNIQSPQQLVGYGSKFRVSWAAWGSGKWSSLELKVHLWSPGKMALCEVNQRCPDNGGGISWSRNC